MGLDIVKGNTSVRIGSYTGFDHFRTELASMVGVDLTQMEGYGGNTQWTKEEPFYELLDHSDCHGELSVDECKELMKDFQDHYSKLHPTMKHGDQLKLWKELVEWAVLNNEVLLFS